MTQSYSASLVVSDSISPCSTIKEIIFIAAGQEKPMMQGFGLKVHCVKILRNYVMLITEDWMRLITYWEIVRIRCPTTCSLHTEFDKICH